MNRRGFAIAEIAITGTILAFLVLGMARIVSKSTSANRHYEIDFGFTDLRETLSEVVDCTKTMATINLATDCSATAPKPIALLDASGNPLTFGSVAPQNALQPGTFDPSKLSPISTDMTFNGAGNIGNLLLPSPNPKLLDTTYVGNGGNWSLRAYCTSPTSGLIIRAAKAGADSTLGVTTGIPFYHDPLTGRSYDWGDSSQNPLFGSATHPALCTGGPSSVLNMAADPADVNARLTLSPTDPVVDVNSTSNTLYLVPYQGNSVPIYHGNQWVSVGLTAPISTSSPVAAGTYDVFVSLQGNSLQLTLTAWSGTRTLDYQDNILVSPTPANHELRYLGTVQVTGGLFEDSLQRRFVANYYNRIPKKLYLDYEASLRWLGVTVNFATIPGIRWCYSNDEVNGGGNCKAAPNTGVQVEMVATGYCAGGCTVSDNLMKLTHLNRVGIPPTQNPPPAGSCNYGQYVAIGRDQPSNGPLDVPGYISNAGPDVQLEASVMDNPPPGHHAYIGIESSDCNDNTIVGDRFYGSGTWSSATWGNNQILPAVTRWVLYGETRG